MTTENDALRTVRLQYRPYMLDPAFPVFAFSGANKPVNPLHQLNENADHARYLHLHNCVEITCVQCASARLYAEDEVHTVRRGDVVMVAPFTAHFLCEEGEGPGGDYLYFDPGLLLASAPPGLPGRMGGIFSRRCACLIIPAGSGEGIARLTGRIVAELNGRGTEYRLLAGSLLVALMVETARYQEQQPAQEGQQGGSILSIMPAVQHINDCYMQPISVGELAEMCHMSGTQLRRVFHAVMGCAPLACIQQVRISRACERLLSTRASLNEIAASVGFESVSSFHRQFVRYHGEAPSVWRRRHLGANARQLQPLPYDPRSNA